ncbi:hypothetical protein CYMTET_52229, partial [Cymbomonas tetramitiformis]
TVEKKQTALLEGDLADGFQVLLWAFEGDKSPLLADKLLSTDVEDKCFRMVDLGDAFVKAAQRGRHALLERLAGHNALPVAELLPGANRTVRPGAWRLCPRACPNSRRGGDVDWGNGGRHQELVARLPLAAETLKGRVREHLTAPTLTLAAWTEVDVINWLLLQGGQMSMVAPFRASHIAGAQLSLLINSLEEDEVKAGDMPTARALSSGLHVMQWALRNGDANVVAVALKRAEWGSVMHAAMDSPASGPVDTPFGHMLAAGDAMKPALAAMRSYVMSWQKNLALESWTTAHVVNWLYYVGCPELVPAAWQDAATGRQLRPLAEAMGRAPSSGDRHGANFALMSTSGGELYAEGRVLQWAFQSRLRHLASTLSAAAYHVGSEHGTSLWVATHGAVDDSSTPVELAAQESWLDVVQLLRPLVRARLLSIPLALWSPVDVANYLISQGEVSLAQAFRSDHDIDGKWVLTLAETREEFDTAMTNSSAVLLWALKHEHREVATHLLQALEPDEAAWPGGGSALEEAIWYNVEGALEAVKAKAQLQLTQLSSMSSWQVAHIVNWLYLNNLGALASAFRKDGVTGESLLTILTSEEMDTAGLRLRVKAALHDLSRRLKWAMRHKHLHLVPTFLASVDPDQMGEVLMKPSPDLGGRTMVAWIFEHFPADSKLMLQNMMPVLHRYLYRTPMVSWERQEVSAWLLIAGDQRWLPSFEKDDVKGASLQDLVKSLGLPQGESISHTAPLTKRHDITFEWAVRNRHVAASVYALRMYRRLAELGFSSGDTAYGAVLSAGGGFQEVASAIRSVVEGRLMGAGLNPPVGQAEWSRADVANWLHLEGFHDKARIFYLAKVDGASLLQMEECKNGLIVDCIRDDAAVAVWAVGQGFTPLLRRILEAGVVSANSEDAYGSSLLISASWIGNVEVMKTLIDHGARVDQQNSNGYTPLMRSALRGNYQAAKLLLEHNADPAMKNKRKKTAAQLASSKGHAELSNLLLRSMGMK